MNSLFKRDSNDIYIAARVEKRRFYWRDAIRHHGVNSYYIRNKILVFSWTVVHTKSDKGLLSRFVINRTIRSSVLGINSFTRRCLCWTYFGKWSSLPPCSIYSWAISSFFELSEHFLHYPKATCLNLFVNICRSRHRNVLESNSNKENVFCIFFYVFSLCADIFVWTTLWLRYFLWQNQQFFTTKVWCHLKQLFFCDRAASKRTRSQQ